jgi:hypothetical protein
MDYLDGWSLVENAKCKVQKAKFKIEEKIREVTGFKRSPRSIGVFPISHFSLCTLTFALPRSGY